jgi:DNA-binding NarL/FixJ family response regulator
MPRRALPTRLVVLDRHPAFRYGVDAYTKPERDIEVVGSAADTRELWPLLTRLDPDLVLVDYDAGRPDRLALAMRIKARFRARVVIAANEPEDELPVLAALTGVDAIVDKSGDPLELLQAIRSVAGAEPALPPVTMRAQALAGARLSEHDRPIFAMRLAGTAPADIAAFAGLRLEELEHRLGTILRALGPQSPRARFTRAAA